MKLTPQEQAEAMVAKAEASAAEKGFTGEAAANFVVGWLQAELARLLTKHPRRRIFRAPMDLNPRLHG